MADRFTINNNGTSGDALKQAHINVLNAVSELESALLETAPHGRDYQINACPPRDLEDDRAELEKHLDAIRMIREWAMKGAAHAMRQTGEL